MEIPIDKKSIPYRFDMELSGELFTFEVHYNERFDFFSIGIEKDGEVICAGEKVVLNQPLFYSLTDKRLPSVLIIPMDESGKEKGITFENFGVSVLLKVAEVVE